MAKYDFAPGQQLYEAQLYSNKVSRLTWIRRTSSYAFVRHEGWKYDSKVFKPEDYRSWHATFEAAKQALIASRKRAIELLLIDLKQAEADLIKAQQLEEKVSA